MKKSFTPAHEVVALTRDTAETYARQVLAFEAVKTAITEAATKGRYRVRIVQEESIDLQETKTAKGLIKKLKGQGYFVDWVSASKMVKFEGSALIEHEIYTEMEIQWGDEKPRDGVQVERVTAGDLSE